MDSRSAKPTMLTLTLCIILVSIQIVVSMQPPITIGNSGMINYAMFGSVLFQDSFELYNVSQFGLEGPGGGWGGDIDGGYAYGEVVNDIAYDGNKSINLHADPLTDLASNEADIRKWMGGSWLKGYPEFYVRWYHRFANFPSTYNNFFRMFQLTCGKTAYTNPTARIDIVNKGGSEVGIKFWKLWTANGSQYFNLETTYPLETNTWYKFEIYYKYGDETTMDGEYRLWIDGKEIFALRGEDTTPRMANWTKYTGEDIEFNLPKGVNLGCQNFDAVDGYDVWVDYISFADHNIHDLIYWSSFETDPIGKRVDYDPRHISNDGHYQIVDSNSNGIKVYGNELYLHIPDQPSRYIAGRVHSGTQSAYCWGLRLMPWSETTTPLHVAAGSDPITEGYEFEGGPYAGQKNVSLQTLEKEDLLGEQDYVKFGSNYGYNTSIGTSHFKGEWLKWYDAEQKYYSWWGAADPRARITIQFGSYDEIYSRVYFNLKTFKMGGSNYDTKASFLEIIRLWNEDYVSRTVLKTDWQGNGYVSIELGSSKQRAWTPYELIDGVRMPAAYPPKTGGDLGGSREIARSDTFPLSLDKWYYIETYYKMSEPNVYDGGVKVWFCADGEKPRQIINRMDLDTSESQSVTRAITGIVTTNGEIEIFVDDWVIAKSYIGTELKVY